MRAVTGIAIEYAQEAYSSEGSSADETDGMFSYEVFLLYLRTAIGDEGEENPYPGTYHAARELLTPEGFDDLMAHVRNLIRAGVED
jgi:hypothetical protein